MNITRFYRCSLVVAAFVLLASCDSGFDELNTDETSLNAVEPALQLNSALVDSAPGFGNILCEMTVVRQGVSPFTGVLACANLNLDNKQQGETNWNTYYGSGGVIPELVDAISNTDSTSASNVRNMARIWKAYAFMVVTDTYGNVPYYGAGTGFLEGNVFPAYDAQEEIYTSDRGLLEELANASAALDPSQPAPGDIFYEGDVTQWKRLGYSLLLRAAMRLSKVAPETAEQYVDVAVSGGVMQSNDDNAVIRHTANYRNPLGTVLTGGESPNYYLDAVFVDYLQENNDPRLASIAVRYPGAISGSGQTEENATRAPEDQIGMPQGYDANTIEPVVQEQGLASFYAYSQIDRTRMADTDAPTFLVTYSQTQLLMAEAVVRGWAQGEAADLYASGIVAHMQQLAAYGEDTAIDQSNINDYVEAHPLEAGEELEQINTQYWVSSFLNPLEAWANFRRSDYPDVPPNPLAGDLQGEDFIRRLTYPDAELSVNGENVAQAISAQGPDAIGTRVWWDVEQ